MTRLLPFRDARQNRDRSIFVGAALLLGIIACPAQGGGGPENVAVVVNADSWASLAVANEYIRLRRIPECNVVYLDRLPSNLSIDVDPFRERILLPTLRTLADRGLVGQIDCIAYSADIPYSVNTRSDLGSGQLPTVTTPEAAINGLTYLYELVLAKNPSYLSLNVNRYFRRRVGEAADEPFTPEERDRLGQAGSLMREKKWAEAEPTLAELAGKRPNSAMLQYDLACCLARLGKAEEAMRAFEKAVASGWFDVWHAQQDEDLASLRERPEFKQLLASIESAQFETQPPRAFRNASRWLATGEPSPDSPDGRRYLLSTVLAMTSGRGNSVREAIESLQRSAAADGTSPQGTVYYLQNGDVRSTTRQWGFRPAAKKLVSLGVRAEVIEGVLPEQKADVAGAMLGAAQFDWKSCGSTLLPGAICEHLTSFGGFLHEAGGQTPISELIRAGAAGSSGTVTEPYAIQDKFPTPFLHVYYASGCSLAEAFYQSVRGPYQLLILGDPLCRPWAKIPRVAITGLAAGAKVKGDLVFGAAVTGNVPISRYEVFVDGMRVAIAPRNARFSTPSTELCDGFHEIRVTAVADDPVETQGYAVLPFLVDNRDLRMEVERLTKTATLEATVSLRARMPQAKRIVFLQNGREVAVIPGAEGTVHIPANKLGSGTVRLRPVALLSDTAGDPSPRLSVARLAQFRFERQVGQAECRGESRGLLFRSAG